VSAAAGSAWLLTRYYRSKSDPEQRRRALINEQGRIIEGFVLDVREGVVVYSWSWRGVDYEASQDLRSLQHLVPATHDIFAGTVSIKFLPRDPSNSIVLSENWSGFRSSPSSIRAHLL